MENSPGRTRRVLRYAGVMLAAAWIALATFVYLTRITLALYRANESSLQSIFNAFFS